VNFVAQYARPTQLFRELESCPRDSLDILSDAHLICHFSHSTIDSRQIDDAQIEIEEQQTTIKKQKRKLTHCLTRGLFPFKYLTTSSLRLLHDANPPRRKSSISIAF
jgi:hypothetical protein